MFLVVGLGNPTKKYRNTYHNIGFMVVDFLASLFNIKISKNEAAALVGKVKVNNNTVILAKPQTYMNLSGESVLALSKKYKISTENIYIVLDDIDLPLGSQRFRDSGSSGTHNGLKNVCLMLKSQNMKRLRIGIGNNKEMQLSDYVTSEINENDKMVLDDQIQKAAHFILEKLINA